MLTRLQCHSYRAFEELDIPLAKMNLFLGPNNSGKSSILSAINVLSQTLDSTDRGARLLLHGKFENLGTYPDVVFGNVPKRDISIALEFTTSDARRRRPRVGRVETTFHYRPLRREIVVRSIQLMRPLNRTILRTRVARTRSSGQLVEAVASRYRGVKTEVASSGTIVLDHFIPQVAPPILAAGGRYGVVYDRLDDELYDFAWDVRDHLNSVEFIGPFRQSPQRTYVFSGEAPTSVGTHGEKSVDILAADQPKRLGERQGYAERISKWLLESGTAQGIRIFPLTERHYEVKVRHLGSGEEENLADVGFGCSQILPVLVGGYHRPPGSILIVEQPEIHLHPKAQAEVGTFLAGVVDR
ncbi:MAG: AAA family ATPase, partial [Planctomycetota bacterium]